MKRDPRLHGLSSDHHHALVLARRIRLDFKAGKLGPATLAEAARRFEEEIAPHFEIEEEELLPALEAAGRADLSRRTLDEHAEIRRRLADARAGAIERLAEFGPLVEGHVRFEEAELFPACERLAGDEVLERVSRRAPKGKGPSYRG